MKNSDGMEKGVVAEVQVQVEERQERAKKRVQSGGAGGLGIPILNQTRSEEPSKGL